MVSYLGHGISIKLLTRNFRICILVSLSIYILAGREIYRKRRELLNYSRSPNFALPLAKVENPFTSFKTTEFSVTSELAVLSPATNVSRDSLIRPLNQDDQVLQVPRGYDQYSVSVETKPMNPRVQSTNPRSVRSSTQRLESMQEWRNIATVEANTATWTYTKCALFFFVSLLITWVSTSVGMRKMKAKPNKPPPFRSLLPSTASIPSSTQTVYLSPSPMPPVSCYP